MEVREQAKNISKAMPVIIIDIGVLFLVLNYHGHIDLMTGQERQQKTAELENIISDEGCLPRRQARQKLGLSKHEMVEVVRNATNYTSSIHESTIYQYTHPQIIRCYMTQSSEEPRSHTESRPNQPAAHS